MRSRQRAPSQLGDHLTDRLPFPLGALLGGLQDIISNVQGGSHASDASASRINSPASSGAYSLHLARRMGRPGRLPACGVTLKIDL